MWQELKNSFLKKKKESLDLRFWRFEFSGMLRRIDWVRKHKDPSKRRSLLTSRQGETSLKIRTCNNTALRASDLRRCVSFTQSLWILIRLHAWLALTLSKKRVHAHATADFTRASASYSIISHTADRYISNMRVWVLLRRQGIFKYSFGAPVLPLITFL